MAQMRPSQNLKDYLDVPKDRMKEIEEEIREFDAERECRVKNIIFQEKIVFFQLEHRISCRGDMGCRTREVGWDQVT